MRTRGRTVLTCRFPRRSRSTIIDEAQRDRSRQSRIRARTAAASSSGRAVLRIIRSTSAASRRDSNARTVRMSPVTSRTPADTCASAIPDKTCRSPTCISSSQTQYQQPRRNPRGRASSGKTVSHPEERRYAKTKENSLLLRAVHSKRRTKMICRRKSTSHPGRMVEIEDFNLLFISTLVTSAIVLHRYGYFSLFFFSDTQDISGFRRLCLLSRKFPQFARRSRLR